MQHLIVQVIEQGIGLCLFDPNGSIIHHILTHVPLERTTEEFALFLTQRARKFGLGTTIAHRARRQLESKTRNACLAAANLIVLRVSPEDGHALAYQFDTTLPSESQAQAQQHRTKEQMAQKIADDLATLPDFLARLRIAKGAKFVDHTIHTPKPT